MMFNNLHFADLMPKFRCDVRVSVCNYTVESLKAAFNMFKKQLCKICSSCIISGWDKQGIFGNSAYNCENTVEYLAIPEGWRKASNPIKTELFEWRVPSVCRN